MLCCTDDPKASTACRNQRRGRGSVYGRDGVDDVSSTSAGKTRRRKSWGKWGFSVAVYFTVLLPSLVAGQSIECGGAYDGIHVKSSTETLAKLNALANGTATFSERVSGH